MQSGTSGCIILEPVISFPNLSTHQHSLLYILLWHCKGSYSPFTVHLGLYPSMVVFRVDSLNCSQAVKERVVVGTVESSVKKKKKEY